MTTSYMHRPSTRIWCAIEGTEALSIEAAEAALEPYEADEEIIGEEAPDEAADVEEETELDGEELEGDEDESDPDKSDAEDDPDEENDEGDEEESDEPVLAIEAPQFWDASGKEAFAKLENTLKALPPELRPIGQELAAHVSENEKQRNAALSRKLNDTATERKRYESAIEGLDQFVSEIDRELEVYAKVDWAAEAQRLSPQEYQQHRARFESLKEKKTQASEAKQQRQMQDLQAHTQAELANLKEIAPDLVGQSPEAVKARTDIQTFLVGEGVPQDQLAWISATEMALARDAMRYRQMMAKSQTTPKPKPAVGKQKRKGLAPGKPAQPVNRQQKRKAALSKKGSLSVNEAVELLM